ncbi:MAG: DUF4340 domain-containing protein [Rickettsiales bacterium]
MSATKTLLFFLACVGLAIGAYFAAVGPKKGTERQAEARLLSDVERASLDKVEKIVISAPSGESVSPQKGKNGAWKLPEKGNFPADAGKIRDFLLQLSSSRVLEEKTSDPKRFSQLGLDDGIEAAFYDNEGKKFFSAAFGKKFEGRDAVYVKTASKPAAYLASGVFDLSAAPMEWANVKPIAFPSGLVESVESVGTQSGYTIKREVRGDKEEWRLAGGAEGKTPKSQSVLESVAASLEAFAISDIKPASELSAYFDGRDATTLMFSLKDGALVMATLAKDGAGKAWARFDVASAPVPSKIDEAAKNAAKEAEATSPPSPLPDKKTEKEPKPQDFVLDYALLQELVKQRAFNIPDFVYDDATKPLSALTQ